jgi:outer membrane protein, heavy metal efflux system
MKALATIAVAVLVAGCATNPAAEYARSVENYEQVGKGAYYAAQTTDTHATASRQAPDGREEWEAARLRIEDQKRAWTEALDASVSRPPVFQMPGGHSEDRYAVLANDPAAAGALLAGEPSLADVTALAVLWNPSIRAARQKARSKLEQYSQVSYLDDTLLQYNAFTKQLMTTVGKPRQKEMTAMKYPFPSGLALKGRIVTEDVRIAERDVDIAVRDVVTAVRIAYYDYLFVGESLRINREAAALLDQMIYIAQAKLSVGIGKYHSVIMGQVESARLADMLLTLEEQRETIIARVNTLLDRRPDAPLGLPTAVEDDDVAASLDELYDAGVKGSQELQKQRTMIARMDLMIQMATRMTYPDATLGASYFEDRMKLSNGARPMPPTFKTQRTPNVRSAATFATGTAYVREAETRLVAMQDMLAGMTNMTELAIRKHHFGMDRARRSIALHRHSLLPQAMQALEAASTAYQTAQVNFVTLLDAERTLLRIQLGEHAALRDYRTHLAELDKALGSAAARKPLALDDINGTNGDGGTDR